MFEYIVSVILTGFFVSLFIYWIIFKTWQNFHEGLHSKENCEGVLIRSFVAGINAGILGIVVPNYKEVLGDGPKAPILLAVIVNVVFWVCIGLIYGHHYRKKRFLIKNQ